LSVTQKLEKEAIGIKMGSKAFEESKVVVASNNQVNQSNTHFFGVNNVSLLGLVDLVCANTR
jgi:hypothetical protein